MSSEQARTEWRTLLDLASQDEVDVVIERHGKATAAVIGYKTYQAVRATLEEIRASASMQKRGQQMAAALEELAELPEPIDIKDAAAWQADIRQDRALIGRENEC
jgi:PHD/YefM family antitoxin component YafN of YafNO toxin-antitoxin module